MAEELKPCPFCSDCEYYYDGYCVNSDSDYCDEWVDDDFCCKNWMRRSRNEGNTI